MKANVPLDGCPSAAIARQATVYRPALSFSFTETTAGAFGTELMTMIVPSVTPATTAP